MMTPQAPAMPWMTPMGFKDTTVNAVGTQKASSTGGVIKYTTTGLIHSSGKNYSAAHAPKEVQEIIRAGRKIP